MNKDQKVIMRVVKDRNNPFVMINKEFLNNNKLSWKAKGILTYLLSLPDDWQIYESELLKHSTDGSSSLKSGMKELIESGYIERVQIRNNRGHFIGYSYCVYEVPTEMRKSTIGNSDTGKPPTTNNNNTNNDFKDKTMIYGERQSEYSDNFKVAEEEESSLDGNTSVSEDIEKEATILLEKMPNLLGMGNFTNAYRDKRRLHSKEELFRTVDRYLELTNLVGWDKFIGCTNFFRNNSYVDYLDINWDVTLANVKNQLKLCKNNKYSSSKNSRSQTLEDVEYDKQLKEAFGGLLDDND